MENEETVETEDTEETCVTPGVTVRGHSIGMTPYHSMNIIHRNSASFLQEGICPLSDWRLEISHLRNNIYLVEL